VSSLLRGNVATASWGECVGAGTKKEGFNNHTKKTTPAVSTAGFLFSAGCIVMEF
jgi:hypothetical protein